jgi:hypothetical protein
MLSRRVADGYINHVGGRALLLSTYTSPTTHQTIYPETFLSNHSSDPGPYQTPSLTQHQPLLTVLLTALYEYHFS